MSQRNMAPTLRLRSAAIKDAAQQSYDFKLREVMYQTAFTFDKAADDIERLQARVDELEGNTRIT